MGRLLGNPYDGDETIFTPEQLSEVVIQQDKLYTHKILRINYTTYDVRRSQDSLNPRTHADFIVNSREDNDEATPSHPYWYGRIVGVFHADVCHLAANSEFREPQHMEFLWVRWYGRDLNYAAGWKAKRLHRLGFVDSELDGAFGFLDPREIIRGVHLIPGFHYGQTDELLAPSIARQLDEKDLDYVYYYVNM